MTKPFARRLSAAQTSTRALLFSAGLTAAICSTAIAGPKHEKLQPAFGSYDFSQLQYFSQAGSDWSRSDRFVFEKPISMQVVIHRVLITDGGLAELLYRRVDEPEFERPADIEPDVPISTHRRATLQTASELKRLGLTERDFKDDVIVQLTGWPATRIQMPYSEMLVDEITFINERRTVTLHESSDCMVKFQEKDRPKENKDDDADLSADYRCPVPFGGKREAEQIEARFFGK